MKFKNFSLIAGAIALSLTAVSSGVKAETISQTPQQPAQSQPAKPSAQGGIQLTPKQQTQIEEIRGSVRKQIEQVLTSQQRDQIKTAMAAGKSPRDAFGSLTFSSDQQTKLQQIMVTSQQKMEAVLTPEQKAELVRMRQQNAGSATQGPTKK